MKAAASLKGADPAARQRRPRVEGGPGTSDPGRIRYTGITLHNLILGAYRIRGLQPMDTGPKRLEAKTPMVERFDKDPIAN